MGAILVTSCCIQGRAPIPDFKKPQQPARDAEESALRGASAASQSALQSRDTLVQYSVAGFPCGTSRSALTWVSGIDYAPFKLFQLSTLWCAAVAKGEFFSRVALGPHGETVRQMLLGGDPGEPWQYGCLVYQMTHKGVAADHEG